MHIVLNFLFKLVLVAAGLVFAACLALVAAVLLLLWGVRAVWCKLTGQPINPFAVRMDPRTGFDAVFRAGQAPRAQAQPGKSTRVSSDDVTDVEAKEVGSSRR